MHTEGSSATNSICPCFSCSTSPCFTSITLLALHKLHRLQHKSLVPLANTDMHLPANHCKSAATDLNSAGAKHRALHHTLPAYNLHTTCTGCTYLHSHASSPCTMNQQALHTSQKLHRSATTTMDLVNAPSLQLPRVQQSRAHISTQFVHPCMPFQVDLHLSMQLAPPASSTCSADNCC